MPCCNQYPPSEHNPWLPTWPCRYSSIWRFFFLCKNSFATNDLLLFGQLKKFPSVIHIKRLNLLHHNSLSQLRLRAQLCFSKYRQNTTLHWKCINYHHIRKSCRLPYSFLGFVCCNRILNLTLWLWILNKYIFCILFFMCLILILCHNRCYTKWYRTIWRRRRCIILHCCDIPWFGHSPPAQSSKTSS